MLTNSYMYLFLISNVLGIITSSDSGQLILDCEDAKLKLTMNIESNSERESEKPDSTVLFKATQGKSIAKNNVFSIFGKNFKLHQSSFVLLSHSKSLKDFNKMI